MSAGIPAKKLVSKLASSAQFDLSHRINAKLVKNSANQVAKQSFQRF